MVTTGQGRGRLSWPLDGRRTLAAIALLATAVVGALYLGGYTRLFRGDEVPPGDVLVVRAEGGVISSVDATVSLDQASGIPTVLTVHTKCSSGDVVAVRIDGTRRSSAAEGKAVCPANGLLTPVLTVGLTEVNAVAALDGGTGVFDLTVDTRDFENPPAKVSVSASLSWSAHFDEIYGDGRATEPREAQWRGSGLVRASGTWSDLVLGRLALRLDNFLLLVIGAAMGFFSSLLMRNPPALPSADSLLSPDGDSSDALTPTLRRRPRGVQHKRSAARRRSFIAGIQRSRGDGPG